MTPQNYKNYNLKCIYSIASFLQFPDFSVQNIAENRQNLVIFGRSPKNICILPSFTILLPEEIDKYVYFCGPLLYNIKFSFFKFLKGGRGVILPSPQSGNRSFELR